MATDKPRKSLNGAWWLLMLVWPIAAFIPTRDFYEFTGDYALLIQIGITVGWILWLYGVYRLIRLFIA